MIPTLHLLHERTRCEAPLLAAAAEDWARCCGATLATIGGIDDSALAVRFRPHAGVHRDIEQWAQTHDVRRLMAWGPHAIAATAGAGLPLAGVLDGLPHVASLIPALRTGHVHVLVTAPALARVLERSGVPTAMVQCVPPPLWQACGELPVDADRVCVAVDDINAHNLDGLLRLLVRLCLDGRPLQLELPPDVACRASLQVLMEQVGGGVCTASDQPASVALAPPLTGDRCGQEAVLPVLGAWAAGARVCLGGDHAASAWLAPLGAVTRAEGDVVQATMALDAPQDVNRATVIDAWCTQAGALLAGVFDQPMLDSSPEAASA